MYHREEFFRRTRYAGDILEEIYIPLFDDNFSPYLVLRVIFSNGVVRIGVFLFKIHLIWLPLSRFRVSFLCFIYRLVNSWLIFFDLTFLLEKNICSTFDFPLSAFIFCNIFPVFTSFREMVDCLLYHNKNVSAHFTYLILLEWGISKLSFKSWIEELLHSSLLLLSLFLHFILFTHKILP